MTAVGFAGVAAVSYDRGRLFEAGDPIFYYAYLRSLVHDGDLDLANDYALCGLLPGSMATPGVYVSDPVTGRADNFFTVGAPLLVAPFYVAVNLALGRLGTGAVAGPFPLFGDQLIYAAGQLGLGFVGIGLAFRFVSSYFPGRVSLVATLAFWLAGPLLYYFVREPFMPHLASLFATSLLLCVWRLSPISGYPRAAVMGLLAGLVTIVRQQDVAVLILPVGVALADGIWRWPRKRLLTSIALVGLGFGAFLLLQLVVFHEVRGTFLAWSHRGQSLTYAFEPKIAGVLFSSNHGLLSWHPIIAVCLLGWWLLRRVDARLVWLACAAFALDLYLAAAWWAWWMGHSFGSRGFLNLTPLFILGLAAIYDRLDRRWSRGLFVTGAALLAVWNAVLMLTYLSGMIPPEGEFSWMALFGDLHDLVHHVTAKVEEVRRP